MSLPYIAGRDFLTIMHNGVTHTVREGMPNYLSLREAVRNKDWDSVPDLLSPAKAVETFGAGTIKVVDGEVLMNGQPLHNAVTQRILEMVSDGFDAAPLTRFLEKLMQNPSRIAVTELYDWLERTSLPITEDGDFLAYKKVRDDYGSFHDYGKTMNRVGDKPSMPRNQVDDVRDRTCSYGLHFCSLSYLPCYHGGQGRVMIVKINPADVVSIPSDYDFAKGRACTYEVISEHTAGEDREAFSSPVVSNQGEPVKNARTNTSTAQATAVLGVEFGNAARAKLVQGLVDQVSQRYSAGQTRNPEQGRVDGFDDAWDNRAPDLGRYQGNVTREAVDYARSYFEGYDKCRGNSSTVTTPAPTATVADTGISVEDFEYEDEIQQAEIIRVLSMPVGYRKHGYDNGWDEGNVAGCNHGKVGHFNLYGAEEGGKGYRRGYIDGYLTGFNF